MIRMCYEDVTKMELGKQIKKYRTEANLSQEELADKIFVSRQTISNWENDKNYPDIKSLVLMSEVFRVSLDNLIKGDLERMKKEIDTQEYAKFQKDSTIFTVLFIALLIVPVPLVMLWKWFGMALYLCLFGIGMYFAVKIEKYKKKYDIQTYKEIVAFTDGKSLGEIVIIALIMTAVMRFFFIGCGSLRNLRLPASYDKAIRRVKFVI